MRIDWYTKGVLTVIAVLLAMVVFKQYVSPDAVVRADGPFAGVLYASSCAACFFDTKTGEIWRYDNVSGAFYGKLRITKLGAPLVK